MRPRACINGYAIQGLVFGESVRVSPAARYRHDSALTEAGRALARDLGVELAALHRVPVKEAHTLGLPGRSYITTLDEIDRQFPRSALPRAFRAAVPRLRDWFAALPDDPVIALGDIQMHNMAVDAATGALAGVFDFDEAAVAHRLEDFKYLPSFGAAFTRVTPEAYSAAGGPPVGLDGVGRFHVLSALDALHVRGRSIPSLGPDHRVEPHGTRSISCLIANRQDRSAAPESLCSLNRM